MSRTTPLLRAVLTGTVGLGAVALLTGCFGPPPAPVETPRPESTGFASIDDGGEIDPDATVEPTSPAAEGFTSLTDDLGVLSIQVPAAWTDVDGSPFTTEGGQQWASIVASTDIDDYLSSYNASGMEMGGIPLPTGLTDDNIRGFLDDVTNYFLSDCDVIAQTSPYDDGFYVGYESGFENCGGVGTEGFGIVAVDNAGTHILYVRAQIAGDDDPGTIYQKLAGTFQASISRLAAR